MTKQEIEQSATKYASYYNELGIRGMIKMEEVKIIKKNAEILEIKTSDESSYLIPRKGIINELEKEIGYSQEDLTILNMALKLKLKEV